MDEELAEELANRFDFSKKGLPYENNAGHLADLRALCSLYLTLAGACRIKSDSDGESFHAVLPGAAAGETEAFEYLSENAGPPVLSGGIGEMAEIAWGYIRDRVSATPDAGALLRMEHVRRVLELDVFSYFALICAYCAAADRAFERVFCVLHGEEDLRCPTVGAVWSAYGLVHPLPPDTGALADFSLDRNRLLYAAPSREWPPMLQPLFLRPEALAFLNGRSFLTGTLAGRAMPIEPWKKGSVLFLEEPYRQVSAMLDAAQGRPAARLTVLCGPEGSGRRTTLQLLTAKRDCRFLLADLREFPEEGREDAASICLVACSLLEGYLPCFLLADEAADRSRLLRLLKLFQPHQLPTIVLADQLRGNLVSPGYLVRRVDYPLPDLPQSLELWKLLSAGFPVEETVEWTALAAKFRLVPGQIAGALAAAADALTDGGRLSARQIERAVLLGNTNRLNEIADPIAVFYTWEDLVLAEEPKQRLRDVCARIRYRHQVETLWGWGQKNAYGKGVSVLLYGPPGTGKTMCAQVLAGELGLPLYRINLAQIISKYIGETAKNLDAVFHEAKNSNVILFFDEADALFAKRTDVKDSNDRHANSESAYLLQKIEEYSGVSILATNLAHNFDEAFRRRIGYIINIPMPSPAERLTLWKNCFPESAPLENDIDFSLLAERLEFSGSIIKSAAAQSAYFAAAEHGKVTMARVARAVRLELRKLGKSDPDFLTAYLHGTL